MVVYDLRGRGYTQLEIRKDVTILQCLRTKDRITVRNTGWEDVGFKTP